MFLPILLFSQWSYSEKNDPFNGKTFIVTGIGYNGDYPYKNPTLVIRVQDNERVIYIDDAGSTACGNPYLDVSFGDPETVLSFNLEQSVDRRAGFIKMNQSDKVFQLIKLLKNKSVAYFKFGTDCSQNTFNISLKGSSKVLDKIFRDIDFLKYDSTVRFDRYVSLEKSEKIKRAKEFAKNFFLEKNINFSPFDWRQIYQKIEEGIINMNLNLTEIIIQPYYENINLETAIRLKLGFENTFFTETSRLDKKSVQ